MPCVTRVLAYSSKFKLFGIIKNGEKDKRIKPLDDWSNRSFVNVIFIDPLSVDFLCLEVHNDEHVVCKEYLVLL